MRKFKITIIMLLAVLLTFSAAGCKKDEPKADDTEKKTEKSVEKEEIKKEEKEEVKEEIPENQNLLTGLADLSDGAVGKRPVAVMVNNHQDALPQYGTAKADIIYEIPVEGDISRLMAIYADYTTVPKICPVRSCRYYFPALALGYDSFYVNWGSDDTIWEYIQALNLDQYDGMSDGNGLFGRDQDRLNAGYALEHTGYFDGTRFAGVVQAEGKRTDLSDDMKGKTAFKFNGMDEQVKAAGADCTNVNINFGATTAAFTYDAASKTYLKQINGTPQMDGSTNTQLAFTNVFVLETSISVRDADGHKEIDWDGGKDSVGYYVSNGGVQKIRWEKQPNNEWSQMKFYDESGNELKVNRGKSYIALNYPGQTTF